MDRAKSFPNWAEILDHKIDNALSSMNCVSLGTIQSFDSVTQTASISINYKKIIRDSNPAENNIDSVDRIIEYPILVKCPVFILSGGIARLTMPISQGDTCLVLFCDREIDTWYRTGVKTYPQSDRMHDLTDAIAVVGVRNVGNALSDFSSVIASLIDKTGERLSQSGDIKATARSTAPNGWLLCYGQAVSRETYDQLFAAIGTIYGSGDGATTFNLPDLRGRTIVGLNNMGGSDSGVLSLEFSPNKDTVS